jgi:DNA replication licensing factor MCM5
MRELDRVAIHEAMEQQTISIAKAGITTMLNSRVSVLAAANPVFGHYDDTKSVGDNIDLMTTILSRFDCIFIVRDVRDMDRDRNIARHVLGVHMAASINDQASNADIDVPTLKKLVAYCRARCAPRLSDEAAAMLSDQYVHIRNGVRESLKGHPGESVVVPITVRQLEALVRLSESLAKMRLSAEAAVVDVEEALRLFKVSTLAASQAHPSLQEAGGSAQTEEVRRAEEFLKRRLGMRMTVNTKKILEEAHALGYADEAVKRAIGAMVMRSELQELNQRKMLRRIR